MPLRSSTTRRQQPRTPTGLVRGTGFCQTVNADTPTSNTASPGNAAQRTDGNNPHALPRSHPTGLVAFLALRRLDALPNASTLLLGCVLMLRRCASTGSRESRVSSAGCRGCTGRCALQACDGARSVCVQRGTSSATTPSPGTACAPPRPARLQRVSDETRCFESATRQTNRRWLDGVGSQTRLCPTNANAARNIADDTLCTLRREGRDHLGNVPAWMVRRLTLRLTATLVFHHELQPGVLRVVGWVKAGGESSMSLHRTTPTRSATAASPRGWSLIWTLDNNGRDRVRGRVCPLKRPMDALHRRDARVRQPVVPALACVEARLPNSRRPKAPLPKQAGGATQRQRGVRDTECGVRLRRRSRRRLRAFRVNKEPGCMVGSNGSSGETEQDESAWPRTPRRNSRPRSHSAFSRPTSSQQTARCPGHQWSRGARRTAPADRRTKAGDDLVLSLRQDNARRTAAPPKRRWKRPGREVNATKTIPEGVPTTRAAGCWEMSSPVGSHDDGISQVAVADPKRVTKDCVDGVAERDGGLASKSRRELCRVHPQNGRSAGVHQSRLFSAAFVDSEPGQHVALVRMSCLGLAMMTCRDEKERGTAMVSETIN